MVAVTLDEMKYNNKYRYFNEISISNWTFTLADLDFTVIL